MKDRAKVLIAGIGGASLGTEILKCLALTNTYQVYGCDISKLAFGHYQHGFTRTYVVDRSTYIESILDICLKERITYIIPGGEEPMVLLAGAIEQLDEQEIKLVSNSPSIISRFSNKETTFEVLAQLGFEVPFTATFSTLDELQAIPYPCVVKPATGSGGSSFVFLASNSDEAFVYVSYLLRNDKQVIVQEYISHDEGEYTVGVLSLPDQHVVGSVALKRLFNSKLSVFSKGELGLISSGYSQGLIDEFPEISSTAERIAIAIGSEGPINIQGRVKDGIFIPFEINPRFSASSYLRAMAGFNEVGIFLQYLAQGVCSAPGPIKPGYYLRSLSEVFVAKEACKLD